MAFESIKKNFDRFGYLKAKSGKYRISDTMHIFFEERGSMLLVKAIEKRINGDIPYILMKFKNDRVGAYNVDAFHDLRLPQNIIDYFYHIRVAELKQFAAFIRSFSDFFSGLHLCEYRGDKLDFKESRNNDFRMEIRFPTIGDSLVIWIDEQKPSLHIACRCEGGAKVFGDTDASTVCDFDRLSTVIRGNCGCAYPDVSEFLGFLNLYLGKCGVDWRPIDGLFPEDFFAM